jgi:hypothetical protein
MSFIHVFDFNISKIILALIITMKSTMETVTVKIRKTHHGVVGDEVSWRHHLQGACPEPSVDVDGLEVSGLASLDLLVAKSSGGVKVFDVRRPHQAHDEVLLGLALNADLKKKLEKHYHYIQF